MSTLVGREVRFATTRDGLALDEQGEIRGRIVDCVCDTVAVETEAGIVVLPRSAVDNLRDVVEEPGGSAGRSAADG
jgi:hypothetical protein